MLGIDLDKLESIKNKQEIIDFLVDNNIIKEKKFKENLAYEKEIEKLQLEMVRLQSYVVDKKKRVLVIFEGRDTSGKGGTISRIIQNMNPKKFRVIALPKPTETEKGQWLFQRYFKGLPNEGEIVFWDRSWYNRAVVDPVFGFCTEKQYQQFMHQVNDVERLLVEDGIEITKIFLSISKKEQKKRLKDRAKNPLKEWKLGELDKQAQDKWDDYTQYINLMLAQTATALNPWIEIKTDDKKKARLAVMNFLLCKIEDFDKRDLISNSDVIIKHEGNGNF